MTDRPRLTLLGLATAAMLAIVPVLAGVLLVVASARDADNAKPAANAERHVSVRHLAALKTFEQAIVRRDRVQGRMPDGDALLERFPQCRKEWDRPHGLLIDARRMLMGVAPSGLSPAARMAAELEAIDSALLRFSSGANRRVTEKVGFDAARWFDAVASALQTPVEAAGYPGQRFWVRCGDIANAVSALARAEGRMLAALAWRGTEVDRLIARWRADQFVEISPRQVARSNPWTGLPGCIYLTHGVGNEATRYYVASGRAIQNDLCVHPEMLGGTEVSARATRIAGDTTESLPFDDVRWKAPPSLPALLQPLEALHRPTGTLYRAYTEPSETSSYTYGPNRIRIAGNDVDVGFSIDLTIDPELQALAQQTAACYTGRQDVCAALGLRRKEDGPRAIGAAMLEHAMVRMAAIAIVDVESGRIEALAGALSPCTREEYDGPGRSTRCDRRLPYPIRYRPDALLNPAVFHDAMPASTIKPIMAAAFLSDPVVGTRWLAAEQAEMARDARAVPSAASLRAQLMRSDSARFLDRMFCADKGFVACQRLWSVQKAARDFGWNAACTSPSAVCGKRDLLFGVAADAERADGVRPLALDVAYGRLLTEPRGGKLGAPFGVRAETALDVSRVRQCAAGPDGARGTRDDWEKCRGAVVVDVVAEGWGQGHARATALGSAGMMAMLAAAANGQTTVRKPHLVSALRGTSAGEGGVLRTAVSRMHLDDPEPNPISPAAAQVILSGLSFGHRAGTSRLACEQVFEARACRDIDWIAGKTGTPTFPNDDRSLSELARLCAARPPEGARPLGGAAQPLGGERTSAARDPRSSEVRMACSPLRPYKWYTAAYRTDPKDGRWTKVIAVLTERNWIAATGRVHGAGDHGPNPAAEIAMQIAGRHVGALSWSAP